jgi:hypothetical protein
MKKTITVLCLVGSVLIILDTMNAAESLLLFLFTGIISGTTIRIPPIAMMAASAVAITIIILRLTVWSSLRSSLIIPRVKHVIRTKRTGQNVV